MSMRRMGAPVLLLAAASAMLALLGGAGWLDAVLPGGLPLGNVLAWLVPVGIAGAAVVLAKPASCARRFATVALAGAVAWLPVSVALAGNLTLNFEGWRGTAWLGFSLVVAACASAALLWATAAVALARLRGKRRLVAPAR